MWNSLEPPYGSKSSPNTLRNTETTCKSSRVPVFHQEANSSEWRISLDFCFFKLYLDLEWTGKLHT